MKELLDMTGYVMASWDYFLENFEHSIGYPPCKN